MRIYFSIILSSLLIFSAELSLANPCSNSSYCYDPDGGSETVTNINNQFHYVFIGAHPDDELHMYPLLKNYCAESNAYCAIIIGSRGRGGCVPGITPTQCGNIRELELKASADYLEADLWQYDLPDGSTEMSPYTWSGVVSAYNSSALSLGHPSMVEAIKAKLRELKTPSSTLIVTTFNPAHGSTDHLDHKVISSLTSQAIAELASEFPIHKIYAEDKVMFGNGPYLTKHPSAATNDCLLGPQPLTITNTNLTNFEVFNHGYNNIYKSQLAHYGKNDQNASLYKFCRS